MKKILNYKILFIFLAFACCFFIFTTDSKATIDVTKGDTSYSLPDVPEEYSDYNYFIFRRVYSDYTQFNLILFKGDSGYLGVENGVSTFYSTKSDDVIVGYSTNNIGNNLNNGWGSSMNLPACNYYSLNTLSADRIIFSTIDIYENSKLENVVFPKTPQLQGVLAPVANQVEMSQVMTQILGVLPLILVVVVSLIGLRKALAMLSQLLHQA